VARRRSQFFLADLVAIIALAGLALAVVRSFGQPGIPVGLFVLIGLVFIVWHAFRVIREAPLCEQCGRRFIPRTKKTLSPVCPQCGEVQLGANRSRKALAVANWAVLTVVLLVAVLIRFSPVEFAGSVTSFIPWNQG
jgi:predicted RNA-binding Zn-ribbon protein involved in translation (DUF1610 family)